MDMSVLRPVRLKARSNEMSRIIEEVPGDQIKLAGEILANTLMCGSPPDEVRAMLSDSLEHPLSSVVHEMVAEGNFRIAGRQAFVIADAVVEELAKTSPGDVRVGDIKLPFFAIYVAFENPRAVFGTYLCEGAYLWQSEAGALFLRLALVVNRQHWSNWLPDPAFPLTMPFMDQTLAQVIDDLPAIFEDKTYQYLLNPFHDMSPEWSDLKSGRTLVPSKPTSQRLLEFVVEYGEDLKQALATVLGVACLLSAAPENMIKPNVIWPIPVQARPGTSHKTVKGALPVRFVSFGPSHESRNSAIGLGVSPRAHWRRGHWRRTPFGPTADRAYRPKWIRPTLVNASHGPAAETSIYRVRSI